MIQLFNVPTYTIDTSKFSNLLHDKIVRQFEERFAQYLGAKYAVSFNSATSAIFLLFDKVLGNKHASIPSMIPPVVANAILNGGGEITFNDNVDWVGDSYKINTINNLYIIDSAQKVKRNQFAEEKLTPRDIAIFSFYPTKPVGSCDGGMIVSDNKDVIEFLRELTFNGMSFAENNWDRKINSIGHKMYMNSLQAYVANENLTKLDDKKEQLAYVRDRYNKEFNLKNTSDHLYRIEVEDNSGFINRAKKEGIVCGIHYDALHHNPLYKSEWKELQNSTIAAQHTVSIPFHEKLTVFEINRVIEFVLKDQRDN